MNAGVPFPARICLTGGFALIFLALWRAQRRASPSGSAGAFFSVTVPPAWASTPEAMQIVDRYRQALAWATGLAIAIELAGLSSPYAMVVALPLSFAVWIIAELVFFQDARHRAMPHAAPAELRRSAVMSDDPGPVHSTPVILQFLPWLILAIAAFVLLLRWNDIPLKYPSRWDAAGEVIRWNSRTLANVMSPLIVGAAQCAMIALIRWLVEYHSRPTRRSAFPSLQRFRTAMLEFLLAAQILIAGVLSFFAVAPIWQHGREKAVLPIIVVGSVMALLALGIYFLGRGLPVEQRGGDSTPDACWWWGLVYVNREDPAILVPKRFGIGYTMNLGNQRAWFAILLVLLVSAGGALVPLLLLRLR